MAQSATSAGSRSTRRRWDGESATARCRSSPSTPPASTGWGRRAFSGGSRWRGRWTPPPRTWCWARTAGARTPVEATGPVYAADALADCRRTCRPTVRAKIETLPCRGVLAVHSLRGAAVGDRPGRTFGKEEIHLAEAMADQGRRRPSTTLGCSRDVRAQRVRPSVGARESRPRAEAQKTRSGS